MFVCGDGTIAGVGIATRVLQGSRPQPLGGEQGSMGGALLLALSRFCFFICLFVFEWEYLDTEH